MYISRVTLDSRLVLRDGSRALSGDWNIGGWRLRNAADPLVASDYATKNYVDGMAGGLPPGNNGGVLAYAGGAWASIAAGVAGQFLRSAGALAPTWHTLVASDVGAVPTSRTISAGTGLSGGGDLTANRTLSAAFGAIAGTVCEGNDSRLSDARTPSTAGTNGGVMHYAGGVWASSAAGTARQVFTSNGAGAPTWGQSVLPLRIGASLSTALPADAALGIEWTNRSIVVRNFLDSTWLDVWRVDGGAYWVYGTDDAATSSGTVILAPLSAELRLKSGANTHVLVSSTGALTLGTTSHTTAIQGSSLTIGITSVVAVYQGGARVPERTLNTSTVLGAQDEVVFVDTTGGAVTLTLPAGASGRVLCIQRIAGSNNVVIDRAGGDTIRQGGTGALTSWTVNDDSRHSLIFRSAATEWVAEA